MKLVILITVSIFFTFLKIGGSSTQEDKPGDDTAEPSENGNETYSEDYAEIENTIGLRADLHVKVKVGETNFEYSLEGYTRNGEKMVVGGFYYNNPKTASGLARLVLNIVSDISRIQFETNGNRLGIFVDSERGEYYDFEVVPPSSVNVEYLKVGQINASAIKIIGPGRSNKNY